MRLSRDGAKRIAKFEGYRSHPYRDAVGVWTIGYGHTGGVGPNSRPMSRERALHWLMADAHLAADAVRAGVHVPINQCEFDALVSLTYNIGTEAFRGSTVLRMLNKRRRVAAGAAFLMWNKGGGRVLLGLSRRRRAERRLFRGKSRRHCGRRVHV